MESAVLRRSGPPTSASGAGTYNPGHDKRISWPVTSSADSPSGTNSNQNFPDSHYLLVQNSRHPKLGMKADGLTATSSSVKTPMPTTHQSSRASIVTSTLCYNTSTQTDSPYSLGRNFPWSNNFHLVSIVDTSPPSVDIKGKKLNEKAIQTGVINDKNYFSHNTSSSQLFENGHYKHPSVLYSSGTNRATQSQYAGKEVLRNYPNETFTPQRHNILNNKTAPYILNKDHHHVSDTRSESASSDLSDDDTLCGKEEIFTDQDNQSVCSRPTSHLGISRKDLISMPTSNDLNRDVFSWIEKNQNMADSRPVRNHLWHDANAYRRANTSNLSAMINSSQTRLDILQDKIHHSNSPMQLGRYSTLQTPPDLRGGLDLSSKIILSEDEHDLSMTSDLGSEISSAYTHRWSSSLGQLHSRASSFASTVESAHNNENDTVLFPKSSSSPYLWGRITQQNQDRLGRYRRESDSVFLDDDLGITDNVIGSIQSNPQRSVPKNHFREDLRSGLAEVEDLKSVPLVSSTLLKHSLEKSFDTSLGNHEVIHDKEASHKTIKETDEVLYRPSFQNDGSHIHKTTGVETSRLNEILAKYSPNNYYASLSDNLSHMKNQHTTNSPQKSHIPPDMSRRMSDYSIKSGGDSARRPDYALSSNRSKSSSSLLSDSIQEQHSSIAQLSNQISSKTNQGISETETLRNASAIIPDIQAFPSRNLLQEDHTSRNSTPQTSSIVFAPESVAEVISAVHENLARSAEKMGCLRRLSSASSRTSLDFTDSRPDRNRKETEWTRLRALTSQEYRSESDRLTSRHSLDLGVYLDSLRAISPSTSRSFLEEAPVKKSDHSSMDSGLLVSPRYQIHNLTPGFKPESSRSQLQQQQLKETTVSGSAPPIVPPRRSRQRQQPVPSIPKESPREEELYKQRKSSKQEESLKRHKQPEQQELDKRLEVSLNQVSFLSNQEKNSKIELTKLHKSPQLQETPQQQVSSSQEDSLQEKESSTQQDSTMQQRSSKQSLYPKEINRMQPIPLCKQHDAENLVENSKINFQDLLKQWKSSSPVDSSGSQDGALKSRKLDDPNCQQPWDQKPQWQVSAVPATYELSRTNISIASTYKSEPAQKQESTSPAALTPTSNARPPSSLFLASPNVSASTIAHNSSTPNSSFKPLSVTQASHSPHSTISNFVSSPSHHSESYQRTPTQHPFADSGIISTPSKGSVCIATSSNRTHYFQGGSSSSVSSLEVGSGSSKLTANDWSGRSSLNQDTRSDRFGAPQTSFQSSLHLIRESPKVAGTGLAVGQPATSLQNGHHSTDGHASQITAGRDVMMSHAEVARRNSRAAGMYRRSNSSSVLLSNTAPNRTDNLHSPSSFLPPESNLTQQSWTSELVLSNFGSPDTVSSPLETARFNHFRRDTANLARNYAADSTTLPLPVRPPRPSASNRHNSGWTPSTSPADSRAQVPPLGDSLTRRAISASLSELSNISTGPTPPRDHVSSLVSGESPQRHPAERDHQAPTAMFDSRQSFSLTPERAHHTSYFPNSQHTLNENLQVDGWTHTLPPRGYDDFRAPLLSSKSNSPKSGTSKTSESTKPSICYDSNSPFFRSGDNLFPKQVTLLASNSASQKTSAPLTPPSRSPTQGKDSTLQNAAQLTFIPHLPSDTSKTYSLAHHSNHSTTPDSQTQTSQLNTSHEGYEETTQQVFRELSDKDRKLVEVLLQTSNQRRMLYMEGLFSDVLGPGSKLSLQQRPPSPLSIKGYTMSRQRSMNSFKRNSLPRDYRTSTSQTSSDVPDTDGSASHQNLSRTSSDSASSSHQSLSRTSSDCSDRAALLKLKEELLDKLQKKVDVMKEERVRLQRLADENNLFGEKVCKLVESRCSSWNQVDKLRSHLDDLDKIVRLLLNLSGQLSRAENAVQALGPDTDKQLKKQAKDKRDQLFARHEEAQQLKKSIDRRSEQLASFLQEVLIQQELADYRTFTQTKSKLLIELQQVQDQITIAEQQMSAVQHSLPEQNMSEHQKEDHEKLEQEQQQPEK